MPDSTVRLTHYDPRWRQEFQQTRSGVLQSCEGWVTCVEHIGSTAIPGLIARPIIDCVASVSSEEGIEPAAMSIEGLNFRRVPSPTWAAAATMLVKPRHGDVTHVVVLTRADSKLWKLAIAVRDFLIEQPTHAVRFEAAKVKRWRSGEGDPQQYEIDKSVFFAHLIDQIEARRCENDG